MSLEVPSWANFYKEMLPGKPLPGTTTNSCSQSSIFYADNFTEFKNLVNEIANREGSKIGPVIKKN